MIFSEEAYLAHYGILRKSGRYPWGSGETQSERNRSFLDTVAHLKKEGMSESEICRATGIVDSRGNPSTTQLRALKSIATNQQRLENISRAQQLHDKGYSNVAIGKSMGINESSVRNLLAPGAADKSDILQATANVLRQQIDEKKYIDVGAHVENQMGISQTKLKTAVSALQEEGYKLHYLKVPQLGTGQFTTVKVLTKEDVPYKEVAAASKVPGGIRQIYEHSDDGGRHYDGIQPPLQIDSKRVSINYKETGGDKADGVIYVRPNVEDVSLGKARYAQVRIAVDGTHYIKGMAVYKDDLPNGVDLVFNTNKSNTGNKLDALKPLKTDKETGEVDQENPFGAVVRQLRSVDKDGNNGPVTSAMNIVNEEGDWDNWSKSLSTQFLSKQSPSLAREQLAETYARKRSELDEIQALTNPAVKRKMLESYADDADASAVHMKAAALPRQRSQVILPLSTLKDTEIYAPNFNNGERVVLVRHPHGGKFEIPELTVNNRNPEGRKIITPNGKDAVGINHTVAARLSGADFDGDTVLVIPNDSNKVKTERALEGLKGFDPQALYKLPDDAPKMKSSTKQKQMGLVSNLITDMTIKGASNNELAAAVRHSMVVIDAEKHHLDYKKSARDNGIAALTAKYQAKPDGSAGGSATLISRAKSTVRLEERKARSAADGGGIDRETGELRYQPTGNTHVNKAGERVANVTKSSKLAEAKDAHDLVSPAQTKIEMLYADHSNNMKALANEARKDFVNTAPQAYSPSAKRTFAKQVETLNAKLNVAHQNAPRERQAQLVANAIVKAKRDANPDMDKDELKKISGQALKIARLRTGADKDRVYIDDDEWQAIQAGAISNHKLEEILNNSNLDRVKELSTPRTPTTMTATRVTRAKSLIASGYTQAEVANQLGISLSTLKTSLSE